jgi:hypothetical protein
MGMMDRAEEKQRKRAAEMSAGRNMVRVNMAKGLLQEVGEGIARDYGQRWRGKFELDHEADDVRNWKVRCYLVNDEPPVEESFFDWPTPDLRAKIALLSQ